MQRVLFCWLTVALALLAPAACAAAPPAVGDHAPDFSLRTPAGREVQLSQWYRQGPVVLVVLRGYPGYQCPVCSAQAGEFLARAKEFRAAGARVLFVYPGPQVRLDERAAEFLKNTRLPEGFELVVDPDMEMISRYGLRWDKPRETAYPATLVIDKQGVVRYALVSNSHGGRAKAATVLETLKKG